MSLSFESYYPEIDKLSDIAYNKSYFLSLCRNSYIKSITSFPLCYKNCGVNVLLNVAICRLYMFCYVIFVKATVA